MNQNQNKLGYHFFLVSFIQAYSIFSNFLFAKVAYNTHVVWDVIRLLRDRTVDVSFWYKHNFVNVQVGFVFGTKYMWVFTR